MRAEPVVKTHSRAAVYSLVVFFTLLMIISAFVRIPLLFTPVPLTLQTLVLYLSIVVLREKASLSQVFYLVLGAAGLPVFANAGAGLLYLAGPTGGYLIGFAAAALVLGRCLPDKLTFTRSVLFFSFAAFLVYFCGISWLMVMHKFSFWQAFLAGVVPFIPGAAIKITLVSLFAVRYKA